MRHRPSGWSRLGSRVPHPRRAAVRDEVRDEHSRPRAPFDYNGFLTPTDLDYWNPFVSQNRLTSPFGTSTRIVCTGFHGVLLECWQADREGNPHKLTKLAQDYPGSLGGGLPGGGPGHFVYPGFIPGS